MSLTKQQAKQYNDSFIRQITADNGISTDVVATAIDQAIDLIPDGGGSVTLQQAFDASAVAGDNPTINDDGNDISFFSTDKAGIYAADDFSLPKNEISVTHGGNVSLTQFGNGSINLNSEPNSFLIQDIPYAFPTTQGTTGQVLSIDSIAAHNKAYLSWQTPFGGGTLQDAYDASSNSDYQPVITKSSGSSTVNFSIRANLFNVENYIEDNVYYLPDDETYQVYSYTGIKSQTSNSEITVYASGGDLGGVYQGELFVKPFTILNDTTLAGTASIGFRQSLCDSGIGSRDFVFELINTPNKDTDHEYRSELRFGCIDLGYLKEGVHYTNASFEYFFPNYNPSDGQTLVARFINNGWRLRFETPTGGGLQDLQSVTDINSSTTNNITVTDNNGSVSIITGDYGFNMQNNFNSLDAQLTIEGGVNIEFRGRDQIASPTNTKRFAVGLRGFAFPHYTQTQINEINSGSLGNFSFDYIIFNQDDNQYWKYNTGTNQFEPYSFSTGGGGGGGNQNLESVLSEGNSATNNIALLDSTGSFQVLGLQKANGSEEGGFISLKDSFSAFRTSFYPSSLTQNRIHTLPDANGYLITSVNGVFADQFGNVNISAGGGGDTSTLIPYTGATTDPNIGNHTYRTENGNQKSDQSPSAIKVYNSTPSNGVSITASASGNFVQSVLLDNETGLTFKYGNTDSGKGIRGNINGNNGGILNIFNDGTVNSSDISFTNSGGARSMLIQGSTGNIYMDRLAAGTALNIVYYNTSTKQLTYGAAPTGSTIDKSFQTVSYASSITYDQQSGIKNRFKTTLTGSPTIAFSNVAEGEEIIIEFIQGIAGGFNVTFPSNTKIAEGFGTGQTINIKTTAASKTLVSIIYDGSEYLVSEAKF